VYQKLAVASTRVSGTTMVSVAPFGLVMMKVKFGMLSLPRQMPEPSSAY
jgi:hypothetical protein